MQTDYFVKWSELDKAIDSEKTDSQYTKFVSTDSYNNVFMTNSLSGDRAFLVEFDPYILIEYEPQEVKGLKMDVCKKKNIDPTKSYLEVKNADKEFDNAFIGFSVVCFDALEKTRSNEEALAAFEKVIGAYHDFFKYKKELSKETEQGLIAELLFLDDCIEKNGQKCVENWMGCEKNKRDFVFERYGVEIKSSKNQIQDIIHISNENQLDKGNLDDLYLKLYIFDENATGIKVEDCIQQLLQKFTSAEYKKIFMSKIALLNINPIDYKGKYSFKLEKTKTYLIDESFPRLVRSNIHTCVFDVNYRVNISGVKCIDEVSFDD